MFVKNDFLIRKIILMVKWGSKSLASQEILVYFPERKTIEVERYEWPYGIK
jgi:hypothetical protein